jgi:REP element-mobilizing transposase RayT
VQQSGQSRTPVPTGEINIEQAQNGQSRTPVPTGANSVVSRFVSTLKRFCNKEYGENIWQARFYDHIIRDREEYEAYTKYIYENQVKKYGER